MLQFLNKLYTEKLLDQKFYNERGPNGRKGLTGSGRRILPCKCPADWCFKQDNFEGIHVALKGPRGISSGAVNADM